MFVRAGGRGRELRRKRQDDEKERMGGVVNTGRALGSDLALDSSPGGIAASDDVEDFVLDGFGVDDLVKFPLDVLQEGVLALLLADKVVVLAHDFDMDVFVDDGDETFVVVARVVEHVLDLMRSGVFGPGAVGRHDADGLDAR